MKQVKLVRLRSFSLLGLVLIGSAIYGGYKYARRKIQKETTAIIEQKNKEFEASLVKKYGIAEWSQEWIDEFDEKIKKAVSEKVCTEKDPGYKMKKKTDFVKKFDKEVADFEKLPDIKMDTIIETNTLDNLEYNIATYPRIKK